MPEPRIPTHRWFQKQNHVRLPRNSVTKAEFLDGALSLIPGSFDFNFGSIGADDGFLQLDFNQGAYKVPALGSERSPDPDFADAGNFTTTGTGSVSGGQAVFANANEVQFLATFESGKLYQVEVDVVSSAASNMKINSTALPSTNIQANVDGATERAFIVAVATGEFSVSLFTGNSSNFTTLSRCSIKEVSTTSGERTTAPESDVFVNADLIGDGFFESNSAGRIQTFGSSVLPFAHVGGSTGLALRKTATRRNTRSRQPASWITEGSVGTGVTATALPDVGDSSPARIENTDPLAGGLSSKSFNAAGPGVVEFIYEATGEFYGRVTSTTISDRAGVKGTPGALVVDEGGGWTTTILADYEIANGVYYVAFEATGLTNFRAINVASEAGESVTLYSGQIAFGVDYPVSGIDGAQTLINVTRTEHTLNTVERIRSAVAACGDTITIAIRFRLEDIGASQTLFAFSEGVTITQMALTVTSIGVCNLFVGADSVNLGTYTFGNWATIALSVSGTSVRGSLNQATAVTDTVAAALAMGTYDQCYLGRSRTNSNVCQGEISQVVITDQFASAADLEAWSPV